MTLRIKALLAAMGMGLVRPPIVVTQQLIDEYNLIVDKKSKLPRAKREEIVRKVQTLVKQGKLQMR